MRKIAISFAEKGILNFLRGGGQWEQLPEKELGRFFKTVLEDEEIKNIIEEYNLTLEDLATIYIGAAIFHRHECLNVGGPLLIPTLLFMEPFRLASICRIMQSEERDGKNRKEAIPAAVFVVISAIYDSHKAAGKVQQIVNVTAENTPEKGNGCAGWIVAGIITLLLIFCLNAC
jgi:hypothetical protein